MRRILVLSLATAAALIGCTVPGGTAGLPARSGSAPASAAAARSAVPPPPATNLPDKIACGSAKSCLAVGTHYESNDITIVQAPALAWDGGKWRSVSLPRPKSTFAAEALDVSCKAGLCLAVGDAGVESGKVPFTEPWAAPWNGSALKLAAPAPWPKGDHNGSLQSVSCVAAGYCLVFGTAATAGNGPAQFIDTWHDGKWTASRMLPDSIGPTPLIVLGISCLTPVYCAVTGVTHPSQVRQEPYIGVWNGSRLTEQNVVRVQATKLGTGLGSVACASKTVCVATGTILQNPSLTGLLLAWNGRTWTAHKTPVPPGAADYGPSSAACPTTRACVVVGATLTGDLVTGEVASQGFYYDGKTWTEQLVAGPGDGKSYQLSSVSCPVVKACVAIGQESQTPAGKPSLLAGFWNGSSWRTEPAPKGGLSATHIAVWSVNSDGPDFEAIVTGAVDDHGPGVTVHPDGSVDPDHSSESWRSTWRTSSTSSAWPRLTASTAGCSPRSGACSPKMVPPNDQRSCSPRHRWLQIPTGASLPRQATAPFRSSASNCPGRRRCCARSAGTSPSPSGCRPAPTPSPRRSAGATPGCGPCSPPSG